MKAKDLVQIGLVALAAVLIANVIQTKWIDKNM